jgi:hypothetical protein
MMFVGPSDDERWAKPTTANGEPVAAHSVISLGVVAVVNGLAAFVGISRRRFMVAMVLVIKMERER